MENQTLFQIEPNKNQNKCRDCVNNQSWKCNSKIIHYCGKRKSIRTDNGLLKIKNKNIACPLYEKKVIIK
jgi:hypothetical protein